MVFRFMNLFGRTQEKEALFLIKELMKKILEINREFSHTSEVFEVRDYIKLKKSAEKIGVLEHDADGIRRKISKLLSEGAFLPMMREGLHRLIYAMDDVADEFEDAALSLVYTRKDKTDPKVRKALIEMMAKTMESVEVLSQVLKATFENGNPTKLIQKVYALEHEVDDIRNGAYDTIYLTTKPTDCVTLQVTRSAIARVADVTNKVEDVCDEVQTLKIAKSA